MTPHELITKWGPGGPAHYLNEEQGAQTAYGWTDYTPEMPDEEILRRLLALNRERAEIEKVPAGGAWIPGQARDDKPVSSGSSP